MEYLTQPTLFAFLLQALLGSAHIPISYLAYRWVRAPLKHERVKQSLIQMGYTLTEEMEETMVSEYDLRDYIWPLLIAWLATFFLFSMTHLFIIQRGWWAGTLEEVIDIFGADNPFPRRIAVGRVVFWAWSGAWIYSFHLIFRRFLAYDLTPSVYIFTFNRFVLAYAISSIVALGVGTFSTEAGVPFNVNIAMVSIITFFIGFFPERGVDWITATAQKALKQQGGISKEKRLAEIEGLSIWHQGRLKQEGIENVQNLAMADVPGLIIRTPFTVTQIVDWVDQAILLRHTSETQFEALEKVGVICASDVLTTTDTSKDLNELADATGLKKGELKVLARTLQSALNIKLVIDFRWQSGLDKAKMEEVATRDASDDLFVEMEIPRGQESKIIEE
jgi:hypothetical protein